ncbi:MAG: hypothetical protein J5637_05555 [Prevotella sp.]|nr:hypothetical protein [Prevotella sp.]
MTDEQHTDNTMTDGMALKVECMVMGATSITPGDTVLAFTPGVSSQADALCSWLGNGAEEQSTALYSFVHPENGLLTLSLTRGAMTRFGNMRSYAMRSVYEIDDVDHARISHRLTPLVTALPPLRQYDEPNQLAESHLVIPDEMPEAPSSSETQLAETIAHCIKYQKRLFIRLDDKQRQSADNMALSSQLVTLLHAIDALPEDFRAKASLGFGVVSRCAASRILGPYLRIVAHYDDLSAWRTDPANTIIQDWRRGIPQAPHTPQKPEPTKTPQNPKKPEYLENPEYPGTSEAPEALVHPVSQETPVGPSPRYQRPVRPATPSVPQIDRRWWERYGKLVKWVLAALIVIIALFTFCKRCTEIGSSAAGDVYVPASDKGFVKKSNLLLRHLVEQGKDCPKELANPKSVEDLMKRYPALVFELPYGESDIDGARAADLRLVGIRPDKITDEDDKRFYYNSDIPSLLEKQRASLGDRMFRIRFADSDTLSIRSIEVVAAMFKLALVKDPWVGTVTCADNTLFPTSNHCFVVWGKSVVPLQQSGKGHLATDGGHEVVVKTDDTTHSLLRTDGKAIDFMRLYDDYAAGNTTLCVRFGGDRQAALYLDYVDGGKLRLKTTGCHVTVYDEHGAMASQKSSSAAMNGEVYDLTGNVKLMVTHDTQKGKMAELMVSKSNPMLTLSSLIHSNAGKARYNIGASLTDRFTQQILSGLSSTLRNSVYRDTVRLSIDPMLSMMMEKELEIYANELKSRFNAKDQWELSFTVMDMATGCVVAAPFFRSADKNIDPELALGRKNPALMRRYVGSSFKPLVALAAVLTRPELARLSTGSSDYRLDGQKAMFLGHTTTAWANDASASGFWNGCASMTRFLAASDDVYPVALVAKALNYGSKTGSPFLLSKSKNEVYLGNNDNFTWANAPFIRKLDYLYTLPDVKAYNEHDSLQMAYYTWDNLGLEQTAHFGLDNITPDPTLLYFDNLTHPQATMKRELVPWVLGQGTNEWNCLKLAEAWTRMLTKRKVEASFVTPRQPKQAESLVTDTLANNAWNAVLQALLGAQQESPRLLTPMQRVVDGLNTSEKLTDKLLLFSKTGTPDNYTRMEQKRIDGRLTKLDVGIYCMALMPESAYRKVLNMGEGRGLMCVVRITRVMSNKKEKGNGIQSSDARNFFSQHPDRLKRFYKLARPYLK